MHDKSIKATTKIMRCPSGEQIEIDIMKETRKMETLSDAMNSGNLYHG